MSPIAIGRTDPIPRMRWRALAPASRRAATRAALGAVALLLCILFGYADPTQAWAGYLVAYLFWLGLALGAMALTMIHALTGGRWGEVLRLHWAAALWTLPLLALALVPLLVGMPALFPWLKAGAEPGAQFARQAWYLNAPFLLGRAMVCMLLWLLLAFVMLRQLERDAQCTVAATARAPVHGSAPALVVVGLVIYLLSASLFAIDWVGGLEPRWHSSIFGLGFISLQVLGGFAAGVWVVLRPPAKRPVATPVDGSLQRGPGHLGALLIVMLLTCAYLFYMDYLTAWSGDMPGETVWYVPRTQTSWKWLALAIVALGLVLPLALLLPQRLRRSAAGLRVIALLLLLAYAGAWLWLVLPSVRAGALAIRAGDALAFLGLGALWWTMYSIALRRLQERLCGQLLAAGAS